MASLLVALEAPGSRAHPFPHRPRARAPAGAASGPTHLACGMILWLWDLWVELLEWWDRLLVAWFPEVNWLPFEDA